MFCAPYWNEPGISASVKQVWFPAFCVKKIVDQEGGHRLLSPSAWQILPSGNSTLLWTSIFNKYIITIVYTSIYIYSSINGPCSIASINDHWLQFLASAVTVLPEANCWIRWRFPGDRAFTCSEASLPWNLLLSAVFSHPFPLKLEESPCKLRIFKFFFNQIIGFSSWPTNYGTKLTYSLVNAGSVQETV